MTENRSSLHFVICHLFSVLGPLYPPIPVEVVSKSQIRFKGKAPRKLKTERTRKYVSISIYGTTQQLSLRWGFETTSRLATDIELAYYLARIIR